MIEPQGRIELSVLECRPLGPADAKMIGLHRQKMFLEAGGDPDKLRVMAEHFTHGWKSDWMTVGTSDLRSAILIRLLQPSVS
ncbi:hypothetical protein J2W58_000471 [Pseudomonas psychrotolerans]|nr:hypothetical protein [Pseudomonas psychrotolerans]